MDGDPDGRVPDGLLLRPGPLDLRRPQEAPGVGGLAFAVCIFGGLAFGIALAAPLAITSTIALFLLRPGGPRRLKPEDKLDHALRQMERGVKRKP